MIKVINPGFFTTVQDLGRKGFQAFGVPVGGAMDNYAFRLANLLVGNDENTPALEFTISGGMYEFDDDMLISLTGADMNATLDGTPLKNWASHKVKKGQVLLFAFSMLGCRSYMAVAGGLKVEKIMNSASTHTRSKMGGIEGRQLKKEDILSIEKSNFDKSITLSDEFTYCVPEEKIIRVLPGPQDDCFTADAFDILQRNVYEVDIESDRMGYRLKGAEEITHLAKGADIISDSLIKGAVQVPGSGQPIVMLADCQTTGGYTKLCSVITVDLVLIAQCKPGDKLKFKVVSDDEAIEALRFYEAKIAQAKEFIQKV